MPFGIKNVNIIFHGLFFMSLDSLNNQLIVRAPAIPDHHFIGGIRGQRLEMTDFNIKQLLNFGLIGKVDGLGKPAAGSIDDVDGSIMQFLLSETDVGDFTKDTTKFKGIITLPWPQKFISVRTDDIATKFRYKPGSKVGDKIVANAKRKRKNTVGVAALLQYSLAAANTIDWASQFTIHFYLQPCKDHKIPDVNNDLDAAANCFTNPVGFDLRMIDDGHEPDPAQANGDAVLGTTVEDEQSVNEEFEDSPDIKLICPPPPAPAPSSTPPAPQTDTTPQPAVSPANCPIFFVG